MERIKKKIIIINGKGGCGKDTLCDIAAKKYDVMNVSSITPIKEMANHIGWEGGKTPEDRKFLADLKALVTEYNDGANEYVVQKAIAFSKTADDVMFVHIREPEMIEHFKETVKHRIPEDIEILTLLVKRDSQKYLVYGNKADDEVEDYDYDFIYYNSKPIEEVEADFLPFLEQIIEGFSSVIPAETEITYSVNEEGKKDMKGNTYRLLCIADDSRDYAYYYLIGKECSANDITSVVSSGDFDTFESRKNKEADFELKRISEAEYAEIEQSADLDFSVGVDIFNKRFTVHQTAASDGNGDVFSEWWHDVSYGGELEELRQDEPIIVPNNGRK